MQEMAKRVADAKSAATIAANEVPEEHGGYPVLLTWLCVDPQSGQTNVSYQYQKDTQYIS